MFCLFLDSIESLEHVVDVVEIVCAGSDGRHFTRGLEVLLQMSLVAELAHLAQEGQPTVSNPEVGSSDTYGIVCLRRNGSSGGQSVREVQNLVNLRDIAHNAERAERSSKTGAVAEKTYPLALQSRGLDVRNQAGETTPHTGAVHVTAESGNLDGGVHPLLEALLGKGHEGLLHGLICDRLLVVHTLDLGRDISESCALRVGKVVVVEETGIRLLDELACRGMESQVVEAVEGSLGRVIFTVAVGAIGPGLEERLTLVVGLIRGIESLTVAVDREVTVDIRVFAGQVGLVEVISVLHISTTNACVNGDGSIRANQQGNGASTSRGPGIALGVQRNVASHNNGVTTIPGRRLDPVDGIEDSVGAPVASVDSVDTLDVGVLSEQLHKHRLHRLRLVENGLGADLEAANRVDIDLVVLE